MGLLNLSNADTSGGDFEALPSGTYDAVVWEVTRAETKGSDEAKLPGGTPMLKVQFKITDEKYENRRAFRNFIIPPAKIGNKKYEHADKMLGMLVRFFVAIGYDEAEVKADSGFDPDFEDMAGRECRIVLGRYEYPKGSGEFQNDVKGVKPVRSGETAGNALI